ncbi:hypothetical protein V6N12_076444 [Hibiscus sabdariffa]|uniref:Uncharacterized protein n=1 Tax=Hibiscus sabdariffa TaxID=183260 RepID=A0ABR2D9U0_9ROSI
MPPPSTVSIRPQISPVASSRPLSPNTTSKMLRSSRKRGQKLGSQKVSAKIHEFRDFSGETTTRFGLSVSKRVIRYNLGSNGHLWWWRQLAVVGGDKRW